MFVFHFILSSFFISCVTLVSVSGNCDNCPEHKYFYHYLARGCSPVTREGCPDCIERYDCPIIQKDSTKCYYNGEAYEVNQEIKVPNPCSKCTCSGREGATADIGCAQVECPEIFHPVDPEIANETCYYFFRPGRCCGEKRCPRSESVNLKPVTCSHGNQTYKEGQKIYLDDCYTCSCTADFNPATISSNPACHKYTCYFDIKSLDEGCIPVYLKDGCCHIMFHCPSPSLEARRRNCQQPHERGWCDDSQIRWYFDSTSNSCKQFQYSGCGGSVNRFNSQKECQDYCTKPDEIKPSPQPGKCYFDGVNYDIGATINVNDQNSEYTCTCKLPPDLTCLFRED